ncbi:Peroxiredoxin [Trema orientale]|uniref:glutaredoxin-dependent peroxiredoxin n=1 Tax=Trema orientale TaxID=63057 RepID=A0A2P5F6N0_TREOI|nr:Peroxiredoxin [Trema orientale]
MASSVNNIAATFSKVPKTASSSSSSPPPPHQQNFPLSAPRTKAISTSWNPHASIPKSRRSSLLNLYGPPGPPPNLQPISAVHLRRPLIDQNPRWVGRKLPANVALSYLTRNDVAQTVSLSGLCKGRRVVVVGVSAAFSPDCSSFAKRVELAKSKGWDLIACVAVNDVFVMRAWGEHLAVGERVMMLSDGRGELARELGVSLGPDAGSSKASLGLGVRSRRFCLNTVNGVITGVDFDEETESLGSSKTTVV